MRSYSIGLTVLIVMGVVLGGCSTNRSFGSNIDDFNADASLKRVLLFDRNHDYSDVDITVFEGRVMLTGTMLSEEGRAKLIANTFKAPNVIQIIDEINIDSKTSIGQGLVDARMDQALRTKLFSDRGITSRNYKIAVSKGTIYLIGVARDETELSRALHLAQTTAGARQIVSHLLYQDDPNRHSRTK